MTTGAVVIQPTIAVTAAAYAAGNLVGSLMTLTSSTNDPNAKILNLSGVLLHSIGIVDQAKQNIPMHVLFFDQNPSNTTFTDRAALDVADADMSKICGYVAVTSYTQLSDNSYGFTYGISMPITPRSGNLYAALIAQGAGTYVATTDVIPSFSFIAIGG